MQEHAHVAPVVSEMAGEDTSVLRLVRTILRRQSAERWRSHSERSGVVCSGLVGRRLEDKVKTIDELIEGIEFGWERAEEPTWTACSIMADDDGLALLNDLKDARDARNAARGCNAANRAISLK